MSFKVLIHIECIPADSMSTPAFSPFGVIVPPDPVPPDPVPPDPVPPDPMPVIADILQVTRLIQPLRNFCFLSGNWDIPFLF